MNTDQPTNCPRCNHKFREFEKLKKHLRDEHNYVYCEDCLLVDQMVKTNKYKVYELTLNGRPGHSLRVHSRAHQKKDTSDYAGVALPSTSTGVSSSGFSGSGLVNLADVQLQQGPKSLDDLLKEVNQIGAKIWNEIQKCENCHLWNRHGDSCKDCSLADQVGRPGNSLRVHSRAHQKMDTIDNAEDALPLTSSGASSSGFSGASGFVNLAQGQLQQGPKSLDDLLIEVNQISANEWNEIEICWSCNLWSRKGDCCIICVSGFSAADD